jgi:hypothetical protein
MSSEIQESIQAMQQGIAPEEREGERERVRERERDMEREREGGRERERKLGTDHTS